MRQEALFLQ